MTEYDQREETSPKQAATDTAELTARYEAALRRILDIAKIQWSGARIELIAAKALGVPCQVPDDLDG